ncbi:hypothetical protein B0H19DRAFT_240091 [Mycena capillaripes]|nr:hypothetical protein B0H19DRAFT_240091 [Mycena capillaripes]
MTQLSVPPAYEVLSNAHLGSVHPGSAPPAMSQFRVSNLAPPNRTPPELPQHPPSPRPQYAYGGSAAANILASYHDDVDEEGRSPPPKLNVSSDRRWLAPSPSIRTSSSGELFAYSDYPKGSTPPGGSSRSATSAWTSASGGSFGSPPNRLRNIGEEDPPGNRGSRSLPATPFPVPGDVKMPPAVESAYEKHAALSPRIQPSEYTSSTAVTSPNASSESDHSKPSPVSTAAGAFAMLSASRYLFLYSPKCDTACGCTA